MRRPQHETPARLKALGLETALGSGVGEIWPRLLSADPSGLTRRSDFLPGRTLLVGDVKRALPKLPASLADYDCRNNALTLGCKVGTLGREAAPPPLQVFKPSEDVVLAVGRRREGLAEPAFVARYV